MKQRLKPTFILSLAVLLVFSLPQSVVAATFGFSPSGGSFITGCEYSIALFANATGESSNAAEAEITYNPGLISVVDSDPDVAGKQILAGNAYEAVFVNEVNESLGRIRIAGGSYTGMLTTNRMFAQITFVPIAAGTANFNISFTGVGATYDSNIAATGNSNDLLTGITNGSYTITAGTCPADTSAPTVTFSDPEPGAQDIPLNTNVIINVTDAGSGVDLDSLIIQINDVLYSATSPEVTITGSPDSYDITINPAADFPDNAPVIVQITGTDIDGNPFAALMVFNGSLGTGEPTDPGDDQEPVTVIEVINNVIQTTGTDFFENTPLQDTFVSDLVDNIGVTGTGAIITGVALGLNFIPLLSLLNAPGLIISLIGILLGRRNRKPWGVIIDAGNGKPVAFAACRLYISGTANRINQTVSDTEGRYGFAIGPGSYRLEVEHSDYQKFVREIRISDGEQGYVFDAQLTPKGLDASAGSKLPGQFEQYLATLKDLWRGFRKFLFRFLVGLGFTFSLISVIVIPSLINYFVFFAYLVGFGLFITSKLDLRPKYAAVVDSSTYLRIPYATVKLFDLKSQQLIDTRISNQQGLFDFWGEPGEYGALVTVRGYKFPSTRQTNYETVGSYQGMLKVRLQRGNNRVQLLVDPVGQVSTIVAHESSATNQDDPSQSNLASPFGAS